MERETVYKTMLAAQVKPAESLWMLLLDVSTGLGKGRLGGCHRSIGWLGGIIVFSLAHIKA